MPDELQARLDAAFAAYETRRLTAEAVRAAAVEASEQMSNRWASVRDEVVEPALEEVATSIRAAGHQALVRPAGEGIELVFMARDRANLEKATAVETPRLLFNAPGPGSRDVRVQRSTLMSGQSGGESAQQLGTFSVEDLTPARVRSMAVDAVDAVFTR